MGNLPANAKRYDSDPIIRFMRGLNFGFARLYHRVRVLKACPIPKDGPGILICNHTSSLDPCLLQSACPRIIRWMIAREYYEQRGIKWLFDRIGAIPVERNGSDLAATRQALAALEAGNILGIFPEGKIETEGALLSFQSGIVLLAAKSGAPVYPACLEGTQRGRGMMAACFFRNRAAIAFGEPIILDRSAVARANIQGSLNGIHNAVENLHEMCIAGLKKQ